VATRKISDLTLLEAGSVSSSDTLLLLDNSDPTDQNKRSAVGSIFRAVPSGTYSVPGVQFELKTRTGLFSEAQGQIGLAMGDARLNLQKVGSTLNIAARDSADQNLDFTISAQGTGMIRLGSVLAITDTLFVIPNAADNTKMARFSTADMPTGVLHTYVLPSNGAIAASDTLVTLGATQTLNNKTLNNATFTGTLTVETVQVNGNTTLGDSSADSLTINAASTFSASATFANTVIAQQTLTVGSDITVSGHIDMSDDKIIKLGDDDDLQIKYTNSGDTSSILDTSTGLTIGGADVQITDSAGTVKFFKANTTNSILYHNDTARITTSATGINIGGSIDAVTSITGSGDIAIATDKFTLASSSGDAVFGGNVTANGTGNSQVGSTSAAKLGVGRAPTTYNLEVEGSIYATGSSIICGDTSSTKFILQKRVAGIGLHFTDNTGTDQMVLNSGGDLGVGKNPSFKLDVSGNSNIDGDLTIVTTNPASNTGGKISAREIVLSDPQTGSSATLNASTTGGVSRAKVYFHSFN
tara:strand:+ start:1493 stop:3073 length:1581 start_codon:yes stop_codon:yes gene_type:complete